MLRNSGRRAYRIYSEAEFFAAEPPIELAAAEPTIELAAHRETTSRRTRASWSRLGALAALGGVVAVVGGVVWSVTRGRLQHGGRRLADTATARPQVESRAPVVANPPALRRGQRAGLRGRSPGIARSTAARGRRGVRARSGTPPAHAPAQAPVARTPAGNAAPGSPAPVAPAGATPTAATPANAAPPAAPTQAAATPGSATPALTASATHATAAAAGAQFGFERGR
jgi:cytoskeleton protein RodZ